MQDLTDVRTRQVISTFNRIQVTTIQTIEILAQWVREIKINEVKCGILPKGSTENSMRCTVSQYNREHGHERGVGVHLSYFWEERAVCAVGVSFDEFIKHHKDRKYVNTWRSTAKDVFYSELAKSEEEGNEQN